jgi:amidase
MTEALWSLNATDLARRIASRQVGAVEATRSVLGRIAQVNPRLNALVDVMEGEALEAAAAADRALQRGQPAGPLHGVPVSIKINIDVAGRATTEGVVACRDNIAPSDSPLVAHLRRAGAVIVGRSNTPAFSLRWFTDNALHGRTLNPFDPAVTPGGSSGGAAVAVATGMGAIAHGNDFGGSIRYPAWACGVVGLRTTAGRIAAYKASAPERSLSNQLMSVQGPFTRSVADARLALAVMAQPSALDPNWVPAPLEQADLPHPLRVAVMRRHAAYDADPSVMAAVDQAAAWLAQAGCEVQEVEPPHFEEAAALWRHLVMEDMRRAGVQAIQTLGDAGVRSALRGYMHGLAPWSGDQVLEGLARRLALRRAWSVFFERHPVLLLPNSWQRPFAVDADVGPPEQVQPLLAAQSPQLVPALLGLPGLAVPTGMAGGLPAGVQLCSAPFREDLILRAGELIERAAGFSALQQLRQR